ncbi:MAG: lanthionine synthetase C family protein [Pseudonocardiaceae bacterium]
MAFAVHAAADRPGRYERALASLDVRVAAVTRRRLDQAHARIDRGDRPALAEFDLINGLAGLGAHLLRRDPHGDLIRHVLAYLVRLTEPLGAEDLPGWWTGLAPTGRRSTDLSGGHGNFGMAHGISGPLALLSLAMRRGIVGAGQAEAIKRICSWLDAWRQDHDTGPWWPETITLEAIRLGRPKYTRPMRPSWCYGTPGLARAQQLAGQATADPDRQRMAEQALIGCLTDPEQLRRITDSSLCHGSAGLFQTAWRIAAEAHAPGLTAQLHDLAERLLIPEPPGTAIGLLEGATGRALALSTAAGEPPVSRWDTCLLLN